MKTSRILTLLIVVTAASVGVYYATRSGKPASQPITADPSETFSPQPELPNGTETSTDSTTEAVPNALSICSFNIQFLGNSKERDDDALASLLNDDDIVVVQELVAPPYPGSFPNGDAFNPDPEAA